MILANTVELIEGISINVYDVIKSTGTIIIISVSIYYIYVNKLYNIYINYKNNKEKEKKEIQNINNTLNTFLSE